MEISERVCCAGDKWMKNGFVDAASNSISKVLKPMALTIIIPFFSVVVNENIPFSFDAVVRFVRLFLIVTPGIGALRALSMTIPVTVETVCALALKVRQSIASTIKSIDFFM